MQKLFLGNDPFVFVSYSFKDKEKALVLSRALIHGGCNLWLDNGYCSQEEIDNKLSSSFCVILLVTRSSIVSRHVEREISKARLEKKIVYTVYLENFGFPLSNSDPYRLGECDINDFESNIFKLRDKIISKLPPQVLRKSCEPFYISELNRFYTEYKEKNLPSVDNCEKKSYSFGICAVNDKGEKTTLWSYEPTEEYEACIRLNCVSTLDNPYFLHKNSKALFVNFALLFTSKSTAKYDCDIALTVAISRLDDLVPKVTFVDAEGLLDYEGKAGATVQKLLSHIKKSFN